MLTPRQSWGGLNTIQCTATLDRPKKILQLGKERVISQAGESFSLLELSNPNRVLSTDPLINSVSDSQRTQHQKTVYATASPFSRSLSLTSDSPCSSFCTLSPFSFLFTSTMATSPEALLGFSASPLRPRLLRRWPGPATLSRTGRKTRPL